MGGTKGLTLVRLGVGLLAVDVEATARSGPKARLAGSLLAALLLLAPLTAFAEPPVTWDLSQIYATDDAWQQDRRELAGRQAALEPLAVAKMLKAIVERENPELVIVGKQAIDDDCSQTGQMLAALLGWSQGTFASKVVIATLSAGSNTG